MNNNSQIVNIKCSCKCNTSENNYWKEKNDVYFVKKTSKNFYVLRFYHHNYVLCVFKNYINVSGLSDLTKIPKAEAIIGNVFNVSVQLQIDNLTVKVPLTLKSIFLPQLTDYIFTHKNSFNIKTVSFDQDVFCAIFIRFNSKKYGTFSLFKSAKCMLVGCKRIEDVNSSIKLLNEMLEQYVSFL